MFHIDFTPFLQGATLPFIALGCPGLALIFAISALAGLSDRAKRRNKQ